MPSVVMLSVVMPSVVMPSVVMPSVVMPSVVMPSVVMPTVVMLKIIVMCAIILSLYAECCGARRISIAGIKDIQLCHSVPCHLAGCCSTECHGALQKHIRKDCFQVKSNLLTVDNLFFIFNYNS